MPREEITQIITQGLDTRAQQLNPYEEQPKEAAVEAAILEKANEMATKGIPFSIPALYMPKSMLNLEAMPKPWQLPQIKQAEIKLKIFMNPDVPENWDKKGEFRFALDDKGLHTQGYRFEDGKYTDTVDCDFEWPTEAPRTVTFGRNGQECDVGLGFNLNLSRKHFAITLNPDHSIEIPFVLTTNGSVVEVKGIATGLEPAQKALKAAIAGEPSMYSLS